MKIGKFLHYLATIALLLAAARVFAQEFVIEDIRVEGLQRMTPGTIFNYLPVEVGDTFNDQISIGAVRALFGTGFFDDVRLERDGNILVVIVKERPAIGSIDISGNDDIKTEDLLEGLEQVGFALGRVFNQSQLDQLEREVRRHYTSRGKYGVKIDSTVTPLGNNRVAVRVDISEGVAARIKQINIVGNQAFRESELLDLFELTGPTLISFFTKTDQYSREKFGGDLEKLASHYRDNGYINFDIDSTQVELTPDRKEIYITINITEGVQYTVSGVKLAGELILPEEALFPFVLVKKGSLFSLKTVTDTSKLLTDRLGHEGYAFTNVNFIPDINEEDKTVAITFFIDPGQRVYVRRINFIGNDKTRDEVLRREMRQQEGAWISTPMVERGKERLDRLGYFEEVNVETPAVAGATDLVDVNYTVEEKAFGEFTAGLGYGQLQGLIIQTSVAQDNFLGSGKRIQFAFSNSDFNRVISMGYTNPYYTVDGISRTINLNYSETQGLDAAVTAFDNRVFGGGFMFGVPVSENNTVFAGLSYENTKLSEDGFYAGEVQDFINREGSKFDIIRLTAAFAYDTRNKAIFPDWGMQHRLTSEVSLPSPGKSLEFYKISYRGQWFKPMFWKFVFALKGDVGYGDSFGDAEGLPFFENYYGGGPRSVRGFQENTLGPRDTFGRPLGGFMKLMGGAEVLFPMPYLKKAAESLRLSVFFDAGNIYGYTSRIDPNNPFGPLIRRRQDVDLGELRYSAGFGGTWMSPFGVVSVSWAKPFNTQPTDEIQMFQFNFGTSF
jgi:outer membrane protein insertion porin family